MSHNSQINDFAFSPLRLLECLFNRAGADASEWLGLLGSFSPQKTVIKAHFDHKQAD
jgi:hypothetical protein